MVMRSLEALQLQAESMGINPAGMSRIDIMDAMRGEADDMQLDPMRAKDLKAQIGWGTKDPFTEIQKYMSEDYALEPKLDGARMRLFIGAKGSRMNSGRRSTVTYAYIDRTDNFPHLRAIKSKKLDGTVLDGELMSPTPELPTKKGGYTASYLNAAVSLVTSNPEWSLQLQQAHGLGIYFAFDVLVWKGEDVRHLPYTERRKLLERVMKKKSTPHFKAVPQMPATSNSVIQCLAQGHEGSMLKKIDGAYASGKRSPLWLKIKTMSTLDAIITGFIDGEGRNEGLIGGVKFSLFRGPEMEEVGRFGAMDDELRRTITENKDHFMGQVIEVMGQGKTKHGRIRHPQLVRFRHDKEPTDCQWDQLDHFPEV